MRGKNLGSNNEWSENKSSTVGMELKNHLKSLEAFSLGILATKKIDI